MANSSDYHLTWLTDELVFPDPELAPPELNGLLAAGGDLSTERLLLAYRRGIFPWYNEGEPILWWCPDPRTVLFPEDLHISRKLRKFLAHHPYEIRLDTAFEQVIEYCGQIERPGQIGTWITEDMKCAYTNMHRLGYAHSIECWYEDRLVGGLYGMAIGQCFFGESMFSRETNASKVAFTYLVQRLQQRNYKMIDCQVHTDYLESFGAVPIPRSEFLDRLRVLCRGNTEIGNWRVDT